MQLARFLNKVFKNGGFILTDANLREYIIGNPGDDPIRLKILNKKLHYKLLVHPDLYFGEAYTNGEIIIENGTLTDFLERKSSYTFLDSDAVTLHVAVIIPLHPNSKPLSNFNSDPGKIKKFSIFKLSYKL